MCVCVCLCVFVCFGELVLLFGWLLLWLWLRYVVCGEWCVWCVVKTCVCKFKTLSVCTFMMSPCAPAPRAQVQENSIP